MRIDWQLDCNANWTRTQLVGAASTHTPHTHTYKYMCILRAARKCDLRKQRENYLIELVAGIIFAVQLQ